MKNVVKKLKCLLNESESYDKIESVEDILVESMNEAVQDDSFFSLPTDIVIKLIKRSKLDGVEALRCAVLKMSENKA